MMALRSFLRQHPRLYDLVQRAVRRRWARSEPEWYLAQLGRKLGRPPVFIQVGANDGLRNDPLRFFVVWRKWKGVLVEPIPTVFDELVRNYRHVPRTQIRLLQGAVGPAEGTMSFWTFAEEFLSPLPVETRMGLTRRSSFDRDFVVQALRELDTIADDVARQAIRSIDVPVLTLPQVVDHLPVKSPVDLLVIDAEGHDGEIIQSVDFRSLFPTMIMFESHNLPPAARKDVIRLLEAHGYGMVQVGGDTIAHRLSLP